MHNSIDGDLVDGNGGDEDGVGVGLQGGLMRICLCLVNHQPAALSLLRLGHIRPLLGPWDPHPWDI